MCIIISKSVACSLIWRKTTHLILLGLSFQVTFVKTLHGGVRDEGWMILGLFGVVTKAIIFTFGARLVRFKQVCYRFHIKLRRVLHWSEVRIILYTYIIDVPVLFTWDQAELLGGLLIFIFTRGAVLVWWKFLQQIWLIFLVRIFVLFLEKGIQTHFLGGDWRWEHLLQYVLLDNITTNKW